MYYLYDLATEAPYVYHGGTHGSYAPVYVSVESAASYMKALDGSDLTIKQIEL